MKTNRMKRLLILLVLTVFMADAYGMWTYYKNGQETKDGITYNYWYKSYSGYVESKANGPRKAVGFVGGGSSYAFSEVAALAEYPYKYEGHVSIPSGVASIASGAFADCGALTRVDIPSSISDGILIPATIKSGAFTNCPALTDVYTEAEHAIPEDAFDSYIYSHARLHVPSGKKQIYANLSGWKNFEIVDDAEESELEVGATLTEKTKEGVEMEFVVRDKNRRTCWVGTVRRGAIDTSTGGTVTIPSSVDGYSVVGISPYAFLDCDKLTDVVIPEGVDSIVYGAFARCYGLTQLEMPSSLKHIWDFAFYECKNLTTITLGNQLETLGQAAFYGCSSLKAINLPSSLKTLYSSVFRDCSSLTEVNIPKNVKNMDDFLFAGSCNVQKLIVDAENPYYYSMNNCILADTEEAGGGVIGWACAGSTIPEDEHVKAIGPNAFAAIYSLNSVVIPDNIEYIGVHAFDYCINLKEVTISKNIKNIYDKAFLSCSKLEKVTVLNPVPVAISDNVFHMTETWNEDYTESTTSDFTTATLYVPHGCKAAYQAAEGWKNFQNIVEMEREEPKLVLTKLAVEGDCIIGTAHKASFSVRNDGAAFDGNVYLLVKAESEDEWAYWTWECQIASGEEVSMQADNFAFDSPDTYRFWVATETSDMEGLGSQTIVVTSAATLTARNYTREYGEENPEFGFTADKGGFSGEPVITCEATKESPVGTYPIVIAQGSVDNEFVTYVNGTLTITKAPLTARAKSYTCKQGEEIPALGVEYSGWKLSETENVLTRKPTATTSATAQSAPGTYAIIVSGGEARNYDFNYVNGTLTITEADAILVTAKSYTRAYGEENPVLEYTVEGGTLMGEPTISCEATESSPVGTYAIVLGKGSVTNPNVTFVNGTLTIEKAYQTLTWEQNLLDIEQYTQAELTAEATSGLPVEYHVTDESVCTVSTIGSKHFLDCFGLGETVIYAVQNGDSNWWQTTKTYKTVRIVNTSGIDTIADGEREFDVYSVNGQMVRKSARNLQGLPKGVYIVKGKRVVMK